MSAILPSLTCGAIVVLAGIMLGRSADVIAATTGLGRVWTGAALLAVVTSLPELVTDTAAVGIGVPDLAAGDLFGSSLANMFILGVAALSATGQRVNRLSSSNILTIWLAIILCALGALFVLFPSTLAFHRLRPESTLLLLVYLAGLRTIYRSSATDVPTADRVQPRQRFGFARAAAEFAAGAGLIYWAGPLFASSAKGFADASGLGASFVGTLLVGFSTALPEFVTSLTAVRIGAFELAVATLYGSSACNMSIFFALDLASPRQSIFASIAPIHALSALLAIALMILGLTTVARGPSARRFAMFEPSGGLLVGSYVLSLWLLRVYAG